MSELTYADQDPDLTIYQRIALIVAEMPAVGKGQRNAQQGFMFRGHDDVMNELNPLLSKWGVWFAPRVLERITDQRKTSKGGVLYEVNLHVEYTFYGAGGDYVTASAWGEGTDSGDKSTNKAMTMALKNVLAQVFAVSTAENASYDTDAHTDPETMVAAARPQDGLVPGAPANSADLQKMILDLDVTLGDWIAEAVLALYGTTSAALEGDNKRQAFCRVANTVYKIAVEEFRDGDFPPPTDDQYRKQFAWGFDGIQLNGPHVPLDIEETVAEFETAVASDPEPAATGGQESAEDAPEQQEPLPDAKRGYSGLGDQGHIGTGAPDE